MNEPGVDNATRLDDADALIWAVERDPRFASTIASMVVFDRLVDPDALRTRLERTTRLVHRMRQRVVGNPMSLSPPRWEIDPEFDLTRHLEIVDCPGDGTRRDALDVAGPFIETPFDRNHPLFNFLLIQGVDGDHSALVMKAHHAIADGMGMLQIQLELFDFEADTDEPELPPAPLADPLTPGERLGNAIEFERNRTVRAALDLGAAVLSAAARSDRPIDRLIDTIGSTLQAVQRVDPMSTVLVERSATTWHEVLTHSLPALKAAGARAGTRMNPVFVAGVAKGLGLFHDAVGSPCPLLRMGMPISVRGEGDEPGTGNHLLPIRFETPLDADEPDHLIQIVDALINAQRNDPAQEIVAPAQRLVARLPSTLSGVAFAHILKGSDFLTSNLQGSPFPMWIGSARVLAQFPFGPTSAAAVNVTLLSYIDEAHIGVSVDANATDRPELVAECVDAGLDWVIGG